MLRTAFKMALRQTEGLLDSVLRLMGLTISVPDHTTVSRRAVGLPVTKSKSAPKSPLQVLIDSTGLQVFGAGQWLQAKHGAKSRRTWRKLHLAVDADSGMIVAQVLTDQHTDDPSQVGPLLNQIDEEIGKVTADGAYDGWGAHLPNDRATGRRDRGDYFSAQDRCAQHGSESGKPA